jgi:pSer/pThr/pTyr-binding forkhead associated (FHA) protein
MPKLVLTDRSGVTREIRLVSGINRFGRSAEIDHPLDDPSISRLHCEINVMPGRVVIKDLNSANGIAVDGQPVSEADLTGTRTLRLGSVDMVFDDESAPVALETDPAPQTSPPRVRVVAVPSSNPDATEPGVEDQCVHHPGVQATFVCQKCGRQFCTACVKSQYLGGRTFHSCPVCDGSCVSLSARQQAMAKEETSFLRMAVGTFGYPVRQGGMTLLICGAVFFSLLDGATYLAKYALLFGLFAMLILLVFSVGYLFTFMRSIVLETANGSDRLPGWPGFTGFWDDAVVPFFQMLAIWLVCLGPGAILMFWLSPLAGGVVMLLGLFCLPMCLLTVSLADSVMGLNPVIVFSSISKAFGAYLIACAVFLLVLAIRGGLEALAHTLPVPVLPALLGNFLGLYGIVVEMRILGLFYYKYRERLAWFN